jgi:predicted transcriptional regulator
MQIHKYVHTSWNIMKYRTSEDIIKAMLESANGGANIMKMIDKSFLSYRNAKYYISILVNTGLLAYNEERRTFSTTPKGIKYIQLYEDFTTEFPYLRAQLCMSRIEPN